RSTPRAEALRVQLVLLRVGSQPPHGRLHVMDLGWKRRYIGEAVTDAGQGEAVFDGRHDLLVGQVPGAAPPAAAVDPNHQRYRRVDLARKVQIELQVTALVLLVDQVAQAAVLFARRG